jgi:sodium/potassium-transporting ATPase subunit alpha
VFEIPFNSVNKWSLAIVSDPGAPTTTHIVFLKGAPEIVLGRCAEFMYNAATRPIDDDFREEYAASYERFGSCGERVLGFAYKVIAAQRPEAYLSDAAACPKDGFVFCGLISLVDPPRPGVADAIATCRAAGIKVTMITGDHPLTAEAVARKVNIITRATPRDVAFEDGVPESSVLLSDERVEAVVITGAQINNLSQDDWDAVLSKREVVFARTSPQQKLRLVEHYQRRGEIVAVTGDGVNDAPALKRAQIGIAMGSEHASDVARESADIVLLDDNFASIVGAIEEGRVLFDNLKKTVAYTLAHLWPELVPIFLNLAFSFPLAMNGLMILTIDLLTEQGPAISLAYERAEAHVMMRPPRNLKTDRLVSAQSLFYSYITAGLANALVCMFAYFMVYVRRGIPVSRLAFSLDEVRCPLRFSFVAFVLDADVYSLRALLSARVSSRRRRSRRPPRAGGGPPRCALRLAALAATQTMPRPKPARAFPCRAGMCPSCTRRTAARWTRTRSGSCFARARPRGTSRSSCASSGTCTRRARAAPPSSRTASSPTSSRCTAA